MEQTRARVDAIAAEMDAYRARLDHRYRRVTYLLTGMVAVGIVAVLLGFLLIQGSRWEQTVDGCERSNRQTEATIGLLEDLHARPAAIEIARRRYAHVPPLVMPPHGYSGPKTCREYASERIKGPRL